MASRHLARSIVMQSLWEWDFWRQKRDLVRILERNLEHFGPNLQGKKYPFELAALIVNHLPEIDNIIQKTAPQWPLDQISSVNRNALRIGLAELLYAKKEEVPPRVAIDEAIELAKSFSNSNAGKFVNGVLGTVFEQMKSENERI